MLLNCLALSFSAIIFVIFLLSSAHSDTETSESTFDPGSFDFYGAHRWSATEKNLCAHPVHRSHDPNVFCMWKLSTNFFAARIEILNRNPLVVLFHEFATKSERSSLIKTTESTLKPATVQDKDGIGEVMDNGRIANSTWIKDFAERTTSLSLKVEQFTGFDVAFAENWHVLSYQSGGHYAPHFDHLLGRDAMPGEKRKSNRIATFLLYLHPAEQGGATVFPTLELTVEPKPGDAVLWLNMHADSTKHDDSFHGGCPVIKGTKSAATLWIRDVGQELRVKCPKKSMDFDLSSFSVGTLKI